MAVRNGASVNKLDALRALLTTAQGLASQLMSDPMVERILAAFARLPEPDRGPILRVIERDGTWCRIAEQTADTTGITVRPNPNASLYLHVFEHVDEPTEPLNRDVEVIRYGLERFVYLIPLLFEAGVHEQWTASARELIRTADPALREDAARLAREILALISETEDGTCGT